MKSSISFPAPNGFSAPEDSKPGQPFEVMATVVMGGDGLLTLSAVDGVPVANSEYDEEAEKKAQLSLKPKTRLKLVRMRFLQEKVF